MSKLFRLVATDSITFHPQENGLHVFLNQQPLKFFSSEEILDLKDAKIVELLLSLSKQN